MPPAPKKPSRYHSKEHGKRFVSFLLVSLGILIAVYVIAHQIWKPTDGIPGVESMVKVLKTGRVVVLDREAIDWYVGSKAIPILEDLARRTIQISELLREIEKHLAGLQAQARASGIGGLPSLEVALANGDYEGALKSTDQMQTWAGEYQDILGRQLIKDIGDKLGRVLQLRLEQQDIVVDLRPPVGSTCFWISPCAAMLEVIFWAIFGVITNLLVNSVECLRKGNFRPIERWVAYTKLAYGPIMALILVMAILNGWFDLGEYETRAWSLPLLSFLFGYASRKTATLIDRLFERVLGQATTSIEEGPAKALARRKERLDVIMSSAEPKNVHDLRTKAKALVREAVKTTVLEKEMVI